MEKKKQNLKTVTYTISEKGFKYHIIKGKFLKGSTISKKIHQIEEVEKIKKKLLRYKKILDKGNYYEIKENIRIGALMAYNLHHGIIKEEFENPNDIVISSTSDQKIKEEFDFKNIYSTDSVLMQTFNSNSMKLEKIYKYEIRNEFLKGNNANQFSETEQLVHDVLKREKQVISGRHGDASNTEADIVDESLGIQIEVVTAFKAGIKDILRQKHDTFFLIELIDSNLVQVSEALSNKFYKKNYTSKYQKELAIFCLGDTRSTKEFLKKLKTTLEQNRNIKNNFKKIHFIIYDFLRGNICYICNNTLTYYNDTDFKINFISKNEVSYADIKDNEDYIFVTKNIFKKEQGISVQNGKDFKSYAQKQEMII